VRLQVIFLILCGWGVQAQVLVQKYSVKEGLPQTFVSCVGEDSLGFLWLGTYGGGLARFDGKAFTDYTAYPELQSNVINDLLVDEEQNVWVSTRKGLTKKSGNQIRNITFADDGSVFPRRIFMKNDTLICLLSNGKRVYIKDDSTYREYLNFPRVIMNLVRSNQGDVAVLYRVNEVLSLIVYTQDNHSHEMRCDFSSIHSLFRKGADLMLSTNTGLYRLAPNGLVKAAEVEFEVFAYNAMYQSYIGLNDQFLVLVDESGSIKTLDTQINARVSMSIVDNENLIWLATDGGLFKIQMQSFFKPNLEPECNQSVMAVYKQNDLLWLGTTTLGVNIYKDGKLFRSIEFDESNRHPVTFIKEGPDGRVWVGTTGGLYVISNFKPVRIQPEVISSSSSIDFNPAGEAYVGSLGGGVYFLDTQGKARLVENSRTLIVQTLQYLESKNVFLLATNMGLKAVAEGKLSDFAEVTNHLDVLSIDIASPDTVLLGTAGSGLLLYAVGSSNLYQLNKRGGLSSDNLFFVSAEGNRAWVGTDRGIDLVSIRKDGEMKVECQFGFLDGLVGMETNANAYWSKDGIFLAGLVDGVYQLGYGKSEVNNNRLHVRITQAGLHPMVMGTSPLVVNYDENQLNFTFSKVNKSNPDKYYYTYQLGSDGTPWSVPTQSGVITYNNLMPGRYELNIKAVDQSGNIVFDNASVWFSITPAYYQTLWFKLVVTFLAAACIGLIVWKVNDSKVRQALFLQELKENEKNRLRKDIARDFHDELGNLVARLINYLGLLNINKSIDPEIYQNLNGFAQRILIGAKDFVWTLDPGNDELTNVVVHLKDFGETMFSEKNMVFRFTGEIGRKVPMPIGYSRQINLIFKEVMTNTFRHSGATSVDFRFHLNHRVATITLEDNGVGLDKEMLASSRGMSNMLARAERINAKLDLQSKPGMTRVTLSMTL
jgi:signal transduction histidine kinase/ligand-binding sensor domain-containing protein